MSPYLITIKNSGDSFPCSPDKNVLKAMEQLGKKDIPIGCRGGGCGVCRVQVVGDGKYTTGKMSREQVTLKDEKKGICLACKLIPGSDLKLMVIGKWREIFK